MRYRQRAISICSPAPQESPHCPQPSGKGETLADLIREYRKTKKRREAGRAQYREASHLTDAIKLAAGVADRVPDHQRRVGRKVLTQACERLLQHQSEIQACQSFAELIALVTRCTADIDRFGVLAVYDTACRLGLYRHLNLSPEVVYLHAGTKQGARALGLNTKGGFLERKSLPSPLWRLEPWECEDFLCIYKTRLERLRG